MSPNQPTSEVPHTVRSLMAPNPAGQPDGGCSTTVTTSTSACRLLPLALQRDYYSQTVRATDQPLQGSYSSPLYVSPVLPSPFSICRSCWFYSKSPLSYPLSWGFRGLEPTIG